MKNKPKYIVIHHTATLRDHTTFEAVKGNHIHRGWGNIGYHFFINGKGNLYGYPQARGQDQVGAHTKANGMNYKSIGIALTGNFQKEKPNEVQLTVLKNIIDDLRKEWKIPTKNVLGHREVKDAATVCPGNNLIAFIKEYRKSNKEKDLTKVELLKIIEEQRIIIKERNTELGTLKRNFNTINGKLTSCKKDKKELKVAFEEQQGWFSKQIKKFFKNE